MWILLLFFYTKKRFTDQNDNYLEIGNKLTYHVPIIIYVYLML